MLPRKSFAKCLLLIPCAPLFVPLVIAMRLSIMLYVNFEPMQQMLHLHVFIYVCIPSLKRPRNLLVNKPNVVKLPICLHFILYDSIYFGPLHFFHLINHL
jgi:hypothetical protein